MEGDAAGGLVPASLELLGDHHLAGDAVRVVLGEPEHGGEPVQAQGVVAGGVGEEEGPQGLVLDLGLEHVEDGVAVTQELPGAEGVDDGETLLEVALREGPSGGHHVVADVLRRPGEGLPLAHLEEPPERLADDPAPGVVRVGGHVGDLQEHRADEVDRLEELEVDVHVEGHLVPSLEFFLVGTVHKFPRESVINQKRALDRSAAPRWAP